jgi:hypothetical protein
VRVSAEFDISHVFDVKRIYVIANGHPDVTGVTAEVLPIDHSPAAKSQSVGRA